MDSSHSRKINLPKLKVKTGPKGPSIDYCRCSTCQVLGDYRPTATREKDCLDFYGTVKHDCDLLDVEKEKVSWICRDCVNHDKCPGYFYAVKYSVSNIQVENPTTKYFDRPGSYWEPVYNYDHSLTGHNLTEIIDNPDVMDKLRCTCECKQCKHNLNLTEVTK